MTDIFISYSHKDEAWKDELQAHLRVLQQHGEFSVWDDRQIRLGDNWLPEIEKAINSAKVAILMVSRDFLTSDFIAQEEITKFLQRRQQGGLRVIPLIVRPCPWQAVPWLADLQGATRDNLPLSQFELGSHELEAELSQVVMRVNEFLQEAQREGQKPQAEQVDHTEEITPVAPISSTQPVKLSGFKASQKWLLGGLIVLVMAAGVVAVLNTEWQAPYFTSFSQDSEVAKQQRSEPAVNAEVKPAARLAFEPEMVKIEGGEFQMGCVSGKGCQPDEKPVHKVMVPAFEMGRYEVTVAQFSAFVEVTDYKTTTEQEGACWSYDAEGSWNEVKGNSWKKLGFEQGDDHPVACVSWDDAREYIAWLGKETGKKYRLPTEAEWEYAARAGTEAPYPWGDKASHDYANYGKDGCCGGLVSGKDQWKFTSPIGSFPVQGGLHDMHGNVQEWVEDCYHDSYHAAPKDGAPRETDCHNFSAEATARVLRGGSWFIHSENLRSAIRNRIKSTLPNDNIGFRVAKTL